MRRLVLLLVAAAVAVVATTGASSAPSAPQARVACGLRAVTFLFWPQGHPAIASVRFPEFLIPHLEIYRTGAAYPEANGFGFLAGDGQFSMRPSCRTVAALLIKSRIELVKVQRATTALQCKLAKPAQFDVVTLAAGARLLVIVPPRTIAAVAVMKQTGSTLTYNSKLCKPTPPPA